MRTLRIFLAAAALSACAEAGETPPPSKVVEWSATVESARPTPDGTILDVALAAQVEKGWKVYSLTQKGGGPVPMTVRLDSTSVYEIAGPVEGPKAEYALDPNFGIETETYAGQAVFRVPVKVPAVVDPAVPIELKVRSQACSDKLCLPAKTTTITVSPPVTGS